MNHRPQLPKLHNRPSPHMVATVLDRLLIDSTSVNYSAYKDRNRDHTSLISHPFSIRSGLTQPRRPPNLLYVYARGPGSARVFNDRTDPSFLNP